VVGALGDKSVKDFLETWFNTLGDGGGALAIGDEVRQAGQDARVRLSPDRLERSRQDGEAAAGDELGRLEESTGTSTGTTDMTTHVRVPEEGIHPGFGHDEELNLYFFMIVPFK
jgi:hypothetical protein